MKCYPLTLRQNIWSATRERSKCVSTNLRHRNQVALYEIHFLLVTSHTTEDAIQKFWMRIWITKDALQISNQLRNVKIWFESNKRVAKSIVMLILWYYRESQIISSWMKKRLRLTDVFRQKLRMPFTVHASKVEVLKKIAAWRTLIQKIRMRWLKFLGQIMKGSLENLIISRRIFERSRRKLQVSYLIYLRVWREDCRNSKVTCYFELQIKKSHNDILKRMSQNWWSSF